MNFIYKEDYEYKGTQALNCIFEEDNRYKDTPIIITPSFMERVKPCSTSCFSNSDITFNCPPPTRFCGISTDINLEIKLICESSEPLDKNNFKLKDNALYYLINNITATVNDCHVNKIYSEIIEPLTKLYKYDNQFYKFKKLSDNKLEIKLRGDLNLFEARKAFRGVDNMYFRIMLESDKSKIFSSYESNCKFEIDKPRLYIRYILPSLPSDEYLSSRIITKQINRYVNTSKIKKLMTKKSIRLFSRTIQTAHPPSKIIIFVRDKKMRYFPIIKCEINKNNNIGILSELEKEDLYVISKNNGSLQSWEEFRKDFGSILVIGANDLYLGHGESPYTEINGSLEITVTIKNIYDEINDDEVDIYILKENDVMLVTYKYHTDHYSGILSTKETIDLVEETTTKKNNLI